ncbi:hypothetical protein EDB89DRAFT_2233542 [Lactarius sanguifluus]|nr:hypothetical protein EDB89DRAFT_2233542 [Lactarius sanguifluus]
MSADTTLALMVSHSSNPTYFLTDARGLRFVLRKKLAGQLVSQTAHQVERECLRSQTQLAPDDSPRIARPYSEDSEVIGTPFYITEFLEGRIFTDTSMPGVSPAVRRELYVVYSLVATSSRHISLWFSAVRALGALPSLDPRQVGLEKSQKLYFPSIFSYFLKSGVVSRVKRKSPKLEKVVVYIGTQGIDLRVVEAVCGGVKWRAAIRPPNGFGWFNGPEQFLLLTHTLAVIFPWDL